ADRRPDEREERRRGLLGRDRPAPLLDELDETVGGVQAELHTRKRIEHMFVPQVSYIRPVDERRERIARNEVPFRDLNERIEQVNAFLDPEADDASFVCECGRADCMERVRIARSDYERVRAQPAQFLVVAGHEEPDVEEVVERLDGWAIIRKLPGGP